ncbi:MAG: hydroxymethylbilane synthase [Desulfovibrio sp.]|nr:hydroxymethylbilane synthase [Desulfovibrio sp.]
MKTLTIATRGSRLALWQAEYIKSRLLALHPELSVTLLVIKTKGDVILDVPLARIGGKGLFVKEIEEALLDGTAHLAVHSIKDVPMVLPEGLLLGCIPKRESPSDTFCSMRFESFDSLPKNARLGTSSLRRQAQLLAKRPDLRIETLRGNVDTRLKKLAAGDYDAIVLARAGLSRLGLSAPNMHDFSFDTLLPAVGQGALGIECREDDYDVLCLLAELEDWKTRVTVEAERGFLAGLNGGCQVPIAAHALLEGEEVLLKGIVASCDGRTVLAAEEKGQTYEARETGLKLAERLLSMGGKEILDELCEKEG